MSELKPCPFCGKEMSDDNFFSCDGYPQACGCWEQTHTAQEAINVWNNRPIEDALRADNARMKAALEKILGCTEIPYAFTLQLIQGFAREGLGK